MGNFGKYPYICRQMYNLKQRNKIKYHNILCPTARLITLPTIDNEINYIILTLNKITYLL
jgi:hypothetical protein